MRIAPKRRRSRLALWSKWTVLAGIAILVGSIAGHRTGILRAELTIAALSVGLALAGFALILALAAFSAIWRDGREGGRAALLGLTLAVLALAYPTVLFVQIFSLPAVADVATDVVDPPSFVALAQSLNPRRASGSPADAGISGRTSLLDSDIVFLAVTDLVEERGWEIVRINPPGLVDDQSIGGRPQAGADIEVGNPVEENVVLNDPQVVVAEPGFIEAIAATPVVGFPEDVVIRVQPSTAGTIVDMRSASRVFSHDFGSNSRRIGAFLRALDERLSPSAPE